MGTAQNVWIRNIDMHTLTLNYLYSLYYKPFRQFAHLASIGYWGNPDPYLGAVTPDFISCGMNGDVQIIDVKSFYRDDMGKFEYDCENVSRKLEETYEKYNALTLMDIAPYLDTHKAKREPKTIEVVFIFPREVFEECLPSVQTRISRNLIIWALDFEDGPPILRKVLGNHSQQHLEEAVEELALKPDLEILIRYFRNSNLKHIKLCFSEYLLHSCLQNQESVFSFDEIDTVMVESRPPLLAHLSKKEREDFWRRCLRFLVDVAKVVKRSEKGPNHYEWDKKILLSPYYRQRTLARIKEKLGVRST